MYNVSAEKLAIRTSTGTTISTLKIYSRCLMCTSKKSNKIIENLNFLTLQQFRLPNSLPAVRPSSTMAMAPIFHTIKVIALDLRNCCSEESLSTAPWCFLLSFIS